MCCTKSPQSCPTLCNPTDCSPPGSSVHGILQAGKLEWVPFPSPGHLPYWGIKPGSLMPPAFAGGFFTTSATWEATSDTWRHTKRWKWRERMRGMEDKGQGLIHMWLGSQERKEREWVRMTSKEIMANNFPKVTLDIKPQIQEALKSQARKTKEIRM